MLAVSGQLNPQMAGPSIYPRVSGEVLAILPGALWIARDEAADTAVRVGDVRHEIDGQTVTTRIASAS